MAIEYVNLACTKVAYIKESTPSTNYNGAVEYEIAGANTGGYQNALLLIAFEDLPAEYRYRPIYGARFSLTIDRNIPTTATNWPYISFNSLRGDFEENSVTWNNRPLNDIHFYETASVAKGSGDDDAFAYTYISSTKDDGPKAAYTALKAPGFEVSPTYSLSGDRYLKVYTNAAVSGKRPYLRVSLGETPAYVKTTRVSPEIGDKPNTEEPITFSWSLDFLSSSSYTFADIVQSSATLYWRRSGTQDAYQSISVSGDVRSVTVPANTFPAVDIEWYISPVVVGFDGHDSTVGTAHIRRYADMEATGLAGVHSRSDPDTNYPWTGSYTLCYFPSALAGTDYYNLLFSAADLADDYKYSAIDDAGICFKTSIPAAKSRTALFYCLSSGFNPRTVTWNTKPANDGEIAGRRGYDNRENADWVSINEFLITSFLAATVKDKSAKGLTILKAPGFMLETRTEYPDDSYQRGFFSVNAPILRRAILLDITVTSKPEAVTNAEGYVNPHVAQTFKWELVPDGDYYCYAGWTTASATLYWRQAGASTWNSVAAAAGSSEVSLAAETLSAGSVEWYVTATDDQGTTASSEIYTISTADTLHTATPVYPIDTTENGDAGIRFIWTDASDTGAAPTGADLQYSDDQGATWTDFASPRTSATQYDAPGGGFPSGVLLWRVRSLNADGVAGPWSDAVSFLCFAAPDPPILDSDGKPFLTVTWQSAGQRAYRVTVDGKAYGPYFGDGKSFSVPEYLSDGSHVVRVEIQNEYGLWNGAEITVTVANVPGQPVILSGSFDRDAALRWTCEDATADFLIYRDDVQIGHSSDYSFTDRTVLDFHTWRVINRLPGGYYTASNTVSGTLCTEGLALALLAGGPWIDLTLSENPIRTTTAAAGRSVVLRQFAGREYPDAEAAPYKTLQISFDVTWTPAQTAQARAFEALIGEAVIWKEPGEEAFVGVLSAFQRSHSCPARSYTATVQRIHWREYVDADS